MFKHNLSLVVGTTLVSISVGFWSVWVLTNLTTLLVTLYLMKCNFITICLVFLWCVGFLLKWITLELSQKTGIDLCIFPNSDTNLLSHIFFYCLCYNCIFNFSGWKGNCILQCIFSINLTSIEHKHITSQNFILSESPV